MAGDNSDGITTHGSPAWDAETGSALTAPFLVVCPRRRDIGRWDEAGAAKFHPVLDKIIADHNGRTDKIF